MHVFRDFSVLATFHVFMSECRFLLHQKELESRLPPTSSIKILLSLIDSSYLLSPLMNSFSSMASEATKSPPPPSPLPPPSLPPSLPRRPPTPVAACAWAVSYVGGKNRLGCIIPGAPPVEVCIEIGCNACFHH